MNMMTTAPMAPAGCVTGETTIHRMGEMLWSAIRNGGLLEPALWPAWIVGTQEAINVFGNQITVDMRVEASTRRWFADPVTGLLIAQWHRDGLRLPTWAAVDGCLESYRGKAAPTARAMLAKYRSAWELRMPGLMVAYACGEVPSASIPRATWQQLIYAAHSPEEAPRKSGPERPAGSLAETTLLAALGPELRALRARRRQYDAGRTAARHRKSSAWQDISAMPDPAAPLHAELREWCLFALKHERGGRVSIGYSPTTARGYLLSLIQVFADWPGGAVAAATGAAIEPFIRSQLDRLTGRAQGKAAKACLSFQRFINNDRSGERLALDLSDYSREPVGSANIVPPDSFSRAVAAFDRRGDSDAALIMILMFRAGLRIAEAAGLRVGDVCVARKRIELVVEENDERALKTKTSRRIIPIDVLLDGTERRRLLDHIEARRRASAAGIEAWVFGRADAISPPRLKPIADRIDGELRRASGLEALSHNHLRHSFASYLLATLMLPQDVAQPLLPDGLATVISPGRFRLVADRILGSGRLGAGSLHAVSQLMGHTGPGTTLRYYCHLLDLSLGLYCGRPSTMPAVDPAWLLPKLGVGPDARRKALGRARSTEPSPATILPPVHARPELDEILHYTPYAKRKAADARLIEVATKRAVRPLAGALAAAIDQHLHERGPDTSTAADAARPKAERQPRSASEHVVRWRTNATAADAPKTRELCRLVDQRLTLSRRPRVTELRALAAIVDRWERGHSDIRLRRLGDACAFVELLGIMGFHRQEVHLSLTSRRALGMPSSDVHRFLADRATAPHLAGRSGWRGSLVVQLRARDTEQPILTGRAVRFALRMVAGRGGA